MTRILLQCLDPKAYPTANAFADDPGAGRRRLPNIGTAATVAATAPIMVLLHTTDHEACPSCIVIDQKCHRCDGTGRRSEVRRCTTCAGTGRLINEGTGGSARLVANDRTVRHTVRWLHWIRRQPEKWAALQVNEDTIDVDVCETCRGQGTITNRKAIAAMRVGVVEALSVPAPTGVVAGVADGEAPGYVAVAAGGDARSVHNELVEAGVLPWGSTVSSRPNGLVVFETPVPYAGPTFPGVKDHVPTEPHE